MAVKARAKQAGGKVALAARSIDKLNRLADELDGSFAVQVDMTQQESISAMVDAVVEHYGRIDVLVNNAGRALRAPIAEVKVADFQRIVELNVYGPLLAMQAVIPHMRAQGCGSIVNVSSNVSKMAVGAAAVGWIQRHTRLGRRSRRTDPRCDHQRPGRAVHEPGNGAALCVARRLRLTAPPTVGRRIEAFHALWPPSSVGEAGSDLLFVHLQEFIATRDTSRSCPPVDCGGYLVVVDE